MKIDFFIIGAQKAGTTSLYEALKVHDEVQLPLIKEYKYFGRDRNNPGRLEDGFPPLDEGKVKGLFDVQLMWDYEESANSIYAHNEDAKIIICLRNPIDRAYSAYRFSKNRNMEKEDFKSALNQTDERLSDYESDLDRIFNLTYLRQGLYFNPIKHLYEVFGQDNVHIVVFEDFKSNPNHEYTRVCNFLSINLPQNLDILKVRHNESSKSRIPAFTDLIRKKSLVKSLASKAMSSRLRKRIRSTILHPVIKVLSKPMASDNMDEDAYSHLCGAYLHDVQQLSALTSIDFTKKWKF